MARHLERRRDALRRFTVDCRTLEDALRAVRHRFVGKKLAQGDLEDGISPRLVGGSFDLAATRPFRNGGSDLLPFQERGLLLLLLERPQRLVAEDARQIVTKVSLFIRRIAVGRQNAAKRNKRFLDDVIRLNRWEPLAHKRLHHRTVTRDKLAPSRMLRVERDIIQQRRRCFRYRRHVISSGERPLRGLREGKSYPRGRGNVQERPWFSRTTIFQSVRSAGSIGSGRG